MKDTSCSNREMLIDGLREFAKYLPTFIVQLSQRFHRRLKKTMCVVVISAFLLLLLWMPFSQAQPTLPPDEKAQGYILYVPIPSDISKEAVMSGDKSLKNRLYSLAKEFLAVDKGLLEKAEDLDRIVIFTDNSGQPILPDLHTAQRQRENTSKLAAPFVTAENNLHFTFDSPDYPWSPEELATLTTILNDFYPVAKTVYGNPAFDITVNVRKDPTIFSVGFYNLSFNEITIKDVSYPDVICHEMIHAFRDDMIINLSSFEEGMTRAAEVEVFNRLPNYEHSSENHSYYYDIYYEALDNKKIGSQNGDFFRGYVSPLLRYQLGGYAWAKILLENQNFLADFNQRLYAETVSDPTTTSSESKLLNIATAVQPKVEDKPFLSWYNLQGVLNTSPPKGYILYQRINQLTVDYFYRDSSGWEIMQPGATIEWAIYDHLDQLLDSGISITSEYGWAGIDTPWPMAYTGRIKIVVKTTSPDGEISDVSFRYAGEADYNGIFGITRHADVGSITITPLDDPTPPVSVDVINGAFSAPMLTRIRGRFVAVFENDTVKETKEFNKDASAYFLDMLAGTAVPHVRSNITVDGNLSESDWENFINVNKVILGTTNNTAQFRVLWDNAYLYVGMKMLDSDLQNDSTDIWNDDSVEIYIDGDHNHGTTYNAHDNQFVKGWNDPALFVKNGNTTGVLHGWASIPGGYSIEVAIPWSNLGITPREGMPLGFSIGYNDDDAGLTRPSQFEG